MRKKGLNDLIAEMQNRRQEQSEPVSPHTLRIRDASSECGLNIEYKIKAPTILSSMREEFEGIAK